MGHRERLLAGAKRCIVERGYAHTTARDIVAASGTNLASIGYHFGSKDALMLAALMETLWESAAEYERAHPPDPDLPSSERISAMFEETLGMLREQRALWVASFEAFVQAERSPELREQFAASYRNIRAEVGAELARLGSLSDASVQAGSQVILALHTGFTMQWLADPEDAPSPKDMMEGLRALASLLRPAEADDATA